MFAAIDLLKLLLPVNVSALLLLIAAGVIIYFAILLLLRDEFLMEFIRKFFSAIHARLRNSNHEKQ